MKLRGAVLLGLLLTISTATRAEEGDLLFTIDHEWEESGLGVAYANPDMMVYFHDVHDVPTSIYGVTIASPHDGVPFPAQKLGGSPTTGGDIDRQNALVYAADPWGDDTTHRAILGSNIHLFDAKGERLAYWLTNECDTDEDFLEAVWDVALVPGNPGIAFATDIENPGTVYVVDLTNTSGGANEPSPCSILATLDTIEFDIAEPAGIEYSTCSQGFWITDFNDNRISLVNNSFTQLITSFRGPDPVVYTGIATQEDGSSPLRLWVVDDMHKVTHVFDSGACDNGSPTPSVTPTTTMTPGQTLTPGITQTPFTPTSTRTRTATVTRTPTRTFTHTATRTPTRTRTPSRTPTRTWTPRPTRTRTRTPTPTVTRTPSRTPTITPSCIAAPAQSPNLLILSVTQSRVSMVWSQSASLGFEEYNLFRRDAQEVSSASRMTQSILLLGLGALASASLLRSSRRKIRTLGLLLIPVFLLSKTAPVQGGDPTRECDDPNCSLLATLPLVNQVTYTDTNIRPGWSYFYFVRSVNHCGEFADSTAKNAQIPLPPATVTPTPRPPTATPRPPTSTPVLTPTSPPQATRTPTEPDPDVFDVTVTGGNVGGNEEVVTQLKKNDQVQIHAVTGNMVFNTQPQCSSPGSPYSTDADGLERSIYDDPELGPLCYGSDHGCNDPMSNAPHAGLFRKVGNQRTFVGKSGETFVAAAAGQLSLGINDCTAGSPAPNSGTFSVRVTVHRSR